MFGLFISTAHAQAAATPAVADAGFLPQIIGFLPIIAIFFIFYFLVIRPQVQQDKQHTEMLKTLKKGDAVITQGGILGVVDAVDETVVKVKVAEGTVLSLNKPAVLRVLEGEDAKKVTKAVK